uniref:Uncharacterized protein n=1 Tax=Sphaerodactylus townsendi TaxID=933632 RepID=A0ACB8F354_9SAUR
MLAFPLSLLLYSALDFRVNPQLSPAAHTSLLQHVSAAQLHWTFTLFYSQLKPTSEISNSPEDDATQIPMSQMSGSTPMPMMELTSPERRTIADRRRVRRVGVLADFAKAMVEQGEAEAMERRQLRG